MIFIGIDPGLDGAVAVLNDAAVAFSDMPTIEVASGKKRRREHDASALCAFLNSLYGINRATVAIERQQAMPDQGGVSTFRTGYGFGLIMGILAALKLRTEIVAPVSWKRALMADQPKDKGASILVAKRLFPHAASLLTLKKHHGRADALLIAEFVKRRTLASL